PTTTNFTLSFAALSGPIVVNDVIQDASPSLPGNVAINPNASNNNAVTFNALNTYTGTNSIGSGANGGGTVILGTSSNGPFGSSTAGPLGLGAITMNQTTTNPVITPAGADRTLSNAITLTGGFTAANSTPLNLSFTGPITLGTTGRSIVSNMVTGSALNLGDPAAPQTMTLNSTLTFSTGLSPGAGGLIVVNDAV